MTQPPVPRLSSQLQTILQLDAAAPVVEFRREWFSWGQLAATTAAVGGLVGPGERVAVLVRNRPAQLGLLVGIICSGGTVVIVNPGRGAERVTAELATLGVGTVAGEPDDLKTFTSAVPQVRQLSSATLGQVEVSGERPVGLVEGDPGVAVEMLTSGTTGPPKRIPLTYQTLWRVMVGARHYESGRQNESGPVSDLRLRTGVAIVNAPLVHLGGLFRVLQCLNDGRSFCLLERFTLEDWVDAVQRHQPRTVSLVPTALRMVLEADLSPAVFSSVRSVISGTAPLSADEADAFFEKYGVPVLVSYAATEFGGGVAGWNLADHQKYWATKRGSVGRAHAGCELRIVDADTGAPLKADQEGLLEIKTRQLGDDSGWTRTTDLSRIDEDGFLFILGRADQAIIRGGFKVRPEDVRLALERDPRIRTATVVGRDDPRLGAVPVAAVELRPGAEGVDPSELLATVATSLARYEVPVELRIVDRLPRTPSGKVDLGAVRESLLGPQQPPVAGRPSEGGDEWS
jgi:acyl-CoA synthetase (AMP-forming)/AMP-acid ligase II